MSDLEPGRPGRVSRCLRTRHVAAAAFAMTCAGPFGVEVSPVGDGWRVWGSSNYWFHGEFPTVNIGKLDIGRSIHLIHLAKQRNTWVEQALRRGSRSLLRPHRILCGLDSYYDRPVGVDISIIFSPLRGQHQTRPKHKFLESWTTRDLKVGDQDHQGLKPVLLKSRLSTLKNPTTSPMMALLVASMWAGKAMCCHKSSWPVNCPWCRRWATAGWSLGSPVPLGPKWGSASG